LDHLRGGTIPLRAGTMDYGHHSNNGGIGHDPRIQHEYASCRRPSRRWVWLFFPATSLMVILA
jgi:hypothetical protein